MRCRSAVVKLGGSLITYKHRPYTIRWHILRDAVRQLARYHDLGGKLVVVHGGGSFGHRAVAEIRALGYETSPRGTHYVQYRMLELAWEVLSEFTAAGVPVVLHPTHTLCGCGGCNYSPVARDYGSGLVPLLYGDAVYCGGLRIISGDKLASELAGELGVDCLVFAIDKPGILDERGRVVREVSVEKALALISEESLDETGGLAGKIREASRVAGSVEIYIVGGYHVLEALTKGGVGTRLTA